MCINYFCLLLFFFVFDCAKTFLSSEQIISEEKIRMPSIIIIKKKTYLWKNEDLLIYNNRFASENSPISNRIAAQRLIDFKIY